MDAAAGVRFGESLRNLAREIERALACGVYREGRLDPVFSPICSRLT